MYGKIFESMYEGTLYGQWQALVTMQQLIVLADKDGFVDMTPPALSARTSIPLDIIEKGLEILSKPDPYSRTPGDDGVRIKLIDDHRPWGWYIVNYAKYRDMASRDDQRKQNRERQRRKRRRDAGLPEHAVPCAYCGDDSTGPDHIIPIAQGGSDDPENIVPCCPRCNRSKSNRPLISFITDPTVDWIDTDLIESNPVLVNHIEGVTQLSRSGNAASRQSRHTDTDTDIDTDTPKRKVALATGFDDFWSVYPKKVKKKKALEIWKRKRLHEKTDLLTKDVEFRIDHDDRWRDGYIPDPTTYLNGERWEDEVSKRVKKRTYADEIDDAVRKIAEREGENVNDQ